MVQALAVTPHSVERGISSSSEGGFARDDEADWLVPEWVIEVGVQGGAESLKVCEDVWGESKVIAFPP